MLTNAKGQAIVNLNPPRFEDRGHLSSPDWLANAPLAPSMIYRRSGSGSRSTSVESPDK
jgi:hypothetical protein